MYSSDLKEILDSRGGSGMVKVGDRKIRVSYKSDVTRWPQSREDGFLAKESIEA